MTISKTPVRRRPHTLKKRTADHHRKGRNYIKSYWPYLPMVAIVTAGMVLNSWIGNVNGAVLSYATGVSSSSLLYGTNAERSSNGLNSLSINSKLNVAAQNKAADMAANDYWAHNSPSGKTPWTFISASGYQYQTAGENLAYGFQTSSETIAGWMASPGHRANILNSSYTEVGFGILNIENYQGNGQQTLIVAMYASPVVSVPAPPTPPPAPAPAPQPTVSKPVAAAPVSSQPKTSIQTPTSPVETQTDKNLEQSETTTDTTSPQQTVTKKQDTVTPVAATSKNDQSQSAEPETVKVARVQVITSANVAWSQFALSMIVSVALLIFLLRHSFAWHKVLAKGEQFMLHHPMFDIAIVSIATMGTILLQTSGFIR